MGKLFDYLVIRFILFLTFFFGSSPVLLVLLAVGYAFEKLGLDWLKWILAFGYIGWLFGVGWMVKHTAARMVFEN